MSGSDPSLAAATVEMEAERALAKGVAQRLRRLDPLRTTAWSLMANTVTTSGLGMVFWAVASRMYSPRQLGEDAALLSSMILLSSVSQLNLSVGIPRLLPQVGDRRWRAVLGAYGLTAAVAIAVTGLYLVLVPRLSAELSFLGANAALALGLIGAVVLWNVFALQDAVLTAARWAAAVPVENGIFGLLKIVLMVWLAHRSAGHGIFVAWLLGMALMLGPVNALIFGRVLPGGRSGPEPQPSAVLSLEQRGRIARYLATDYVAALLSQGYSALLPLIVIAVLGRAANAYFYVAALIVAAVGALAQSLSLSLVVEGAYDEARLSSVARRSLVRYVKFVVPAVVVMIVGAPLMLVPFGSEYVTRASTLLRLLLIGTVPQAVVTLYLGIERVRAKVTRVLAAEAATLVLVTAGAVLGMRWYGLAGVGLAWLVAQFAVAVFLVRPIWSVVGGVALATDRKSNMSTVSSAPEPFDKRSARSTAHEPSTPVVLDVGAAVVATLLLLAVGLGSSELTRLPLALLFVTFVPGWAVLTHVSLSDETARVALAVALSLTLCAAGTLAMVWLRRWYPHALLEVAAALSLASVISHLGRHGQAGGRAAAPRSEPAPTETEQR